MIERRFSMLQVKIDNRVSTFYTLSEVAYHAGLHPELIDRFIRLGLIEFTDRGDDGELLFDSGVIPLIRRILRLRNQLGVNYAGVGVILELMSKLEAMEARIRELEGGQNTWT
ncbi:MAG: chaperone modulator CbpM [Syntrophobacteraceae bacterium]|jgi:DNA-binding transcriptional MerR regulator